MKGPVWRPTPWLSSTPASATKIVRSSGSKLLTRTVSSSWHGSKWIPDLIPSAAMTASIGFWKGSASLRHDLTLPDRTLGASDSSTLFGIHDSIYSWQYSAERSHMQLPYNPSNEEPKDP